MNQPVDYELPVKRVVSVSMVIKLAKKGVKEFVDLLEWLRSKGYVIGDKPSKGKR